MTIDHPSPGPDAVPPAALPDPLVMTGVVKRYRGFELALDLTVPRGYVMGFVGANGSGKTTTIKCALGLVRPDAGSVTLADKATVGVVLDQPAYNGRWTVHQVGRVLSRFYPAWEADRFEALTEGAEVPGDRPVKDLSRGMGVKLQVAVALSHGAEFLILDEPTSGLDPYARDQLLEQLREFMVHERHTILFSTHITSDLERIADLITMIDAGRVVSSTSRDALIDGYRLVSGAPDTVTPELSAHLVGLRRHAAGWDALMATADTRGLPRGVLAEEPTLDDIVVRMAKEDRHA